MAAFADICEAFPGEDRPRLNLAQCLTAMGHWAEAARHWRHVVDRSSAAPPASWLQAFARCLERDGRADEVLALYADAVARHPRSPQIRHAQIASLLRLDGKVGAARAMSAALGQTPRDTRLLSQAASIWALQGDFDAARRAMRDASVSAQTSGELSDVFGRAPLVCEGWELTSIWLELDQRLRTFVPDTPASAAEARTLAMRLRLAFRDIDGFLALLDKAPKDRGPWGRRFQAAERLLRAPRFPDLTAEKVFGIGLSRSGTTSLTKALEILGYSAAHYINTFTATILSLDDAVLFDAMTDTPVCQMFETLYHMFPNSRFIYTRRPWDAWLRSQENHARYLFGVTDYDVLREATAHRGGATHGLRGAMLSGGLLYRHGDPSRARQAFEARLEAFFDHYDRGRLLVFDVSSGDGWDKLCGFLGKPVLEEPFPWENRMTDRA